MPSADPSYTTPGATKSFRRASCRARCASVHILPLSQITIVTAGSDRDQPNRPTQTGSDKIGAGTLFFKAKEACPGWRKPSEQKSQDRTGLPVVQVIAGELPRMADEAEQALLASGEHIFARAGQLVRPVVDTVHAAKGRTTTTVKFRPLCRAAMLDLLSKVAIFQRYDQRSKAWRNTDPPADLCALLLAREGL